MTKIRRNTQEELIAMKKQLLDQLIARDLSRIQVANLMQMHPNAVSRLVYGGKSFLFMGDAEIELEHEIIDDGGLESDVLKLAHHGSKTNDEEFINIVSPEFTVISVGEDNKFGHPNAGVLDILSRTGSKILRTDEDGDIGFVSDSKSIEVY